MTCVSRTIVSMEVAVPTRRWILSILPAAMMAALAGCGGGGSTFNVKNPPPPPTSAVAIAFQAAPPTSIAINTTASFTATVKNDASNAGVDWSLSCKVVPSCGTLSTLHTTSGGSVTYTPPASFAGNSDAVNIVAYATADHTQNVVAPLIVSAFGSNLKGTYVLQAQGIDVSLLPYQFGGVIVLDGNGGVTFGEQTVNFYDQNIGSSITKSDSITGGSYFLGGDGRGVITINTTDQDVGQSGVETFSFVCLSPVQALIAQTDFNESATGTMDLQTSNVAPSGGYAFVVSGTDLATASPVAFGGVFNIDSPNTISGAGSIADQNLAGTLTLKQPLSGTLSTPDLLGAVTLNLTIPGFPSATAFQFTGYIVDATHINLIESDNNSGSGSGSTGGLAIGQGSATGTFVDDSSFSGSYVFGLVGTDLTGSTPSTMTSVGLFTADGAGGLANGFTDTLLQQNGAQGTAGSQISAAISGIYSVDIKGTGRVLPLFTHFSPPTKPSFSPKLIFYLTGNGNPALVLDGSDTSGAINYPSVGAGIAYPQSAGPFTFGGDYGFSFTQQNGTENDGTGAMTANPAANTLSGVVDANSGFNPTSNNSLSGTFGTPAAAANGRFPGTFSSPIFDFSPFAMDYYAIDSNHGFFIETDLVNPTAPSAVVTFGYYAARTAVCAGCP
jgi:hypothetical protein